jgi:hypothetical protein
MPKATVSDVKEQRKQLVQQVASSQYFAKSARLREMLLYVCDRVLDHEVGEIHEQEVGRRVFGRPADYDTAADNTVRVHASMLRKRVEQYFANEGSDEPVVIEIPRGNYAPVFRPRNTKLAIPEQPNPDRPSLPALTELSSPKSSDWRRWIPAGLAAVLAVMALVFFIAGRRHSNAVPFGSAPTVSQFWSGVFQLNRPTDVVIGDATLALFEERTGRTFALSEYFDRSYINVAANDRAIAGKLEPDMTKVLLLKRQTNYADVGLLAPLDEVAQQMHSGTRVRFARDFSFREIKTDNVILLGNVNSNPWIEPFQDHETIRWKFDPDRGNYYPVDSTAAASGLDKYRITGQPVEGYATLSLFPNLGGTGTVLIISGTGGSAVNGALSALTDEHLLSQLRAKLPAKDNTHFPYFEALLQIGSRNTLPRDTRVLIVRPIAPVALPH